MTFCHWSMDASSFVMRLLREMALTDISMDRRTLRFTPVDGGRPRSLISSWSFMDASRHFRATSSSCCCEGVVAFQRSRAFSTDVVRPESCSAMLDRSLSMQPALYRWRAMEVTSIPKLISCITLQARPTAAIASMVSWLFVADAVNPGLRVAL
jgi:hypothetical protein